jgi:hypothetical protein
MPVARDVERPPCLRAFLLPFGAPGDDPPCIRQPLHSRGDCEKARDHVVITKYQKPCGGGELDSQLDASLVERVVGNEPKNLVDSLSMSRHFQERGSVPKKLVGARHEDDRRSPTKAPADA